MPRLSIVPTDVTFSAAGLPRIECELNLESSFEGKAVALVVYDRAIYLGTPAAQEEVRMAASADASMPLPGFMAESFRLDPVVPSRGNTGTGVSPDVKRGTGVLFTVEGVLQRARNRKWFLRVTGRQEVPSAVASVELVMRDEKGHLSRIGILGYFPDEPTRSGGRTLLFRLACAGIGGGQVIAASLGRQGGGRNAAVTLHVPASSPDSNAQIGGSASPGTFGEPEPSPRVVGLDLTGFYDSVDDPEARRPRLVQINQAGRRLAGWITDIPRGLPREIDVGAGRTKKIKETSEILVTEENKISLPPAIVFAGDINAGTIWPFTWWVPSASGAGPDPVPEPDELDVKRLEGGKVGRGRLALAPGSAASDPNPALVLQLDTPYGTFGPWTIVRTRKEARWSTALIDELPKLAAGLNARIVSEAEAYLRATQVQPLPMFYWSHVEAVLSAENPVLMKSLTAWNENIGAVRTNAREEISREIERTLAGFSGAGYESVVRDRARAAAALARPALDAGRRSLLEWLELVVSDHWGQVRSNPNNVGIDARELYERVIDRGFVRLGIWPSGNFRYTLTFEQVQVGAQYTLGMTLAAFFGTITKEVVDAAGRVSNDDSFGALHFVGGVVDLSAGAGGGVAAGIDGPLAGSITFESSIRLRPLDFKFAFLRQASIAVVKGTALGAEAHTFTSDSFTLALQNGVELATSKTDTLGSKFDPFKLKPKDLFKLKLGFNLVVAHGALAILLPDDAREKNIPPPHQPGGVRELRRDVSRTTAISFDYDSAVLAVRDELELRLAVDRRLFTHGDGMAAASGFASPEGRAEYNAKLSLARAAAVSQAVRDAFGSALSLSRCRQFGFGEHPALEAGLLNPPATTPERKRQILREAASDWPRWRKVELRVEGVLIARVMGRGAGGPP